MHFKAVLLSDHAALIDYVINRYILICSSEVGFLCRQNAVHFDAILLPTRRVGTKRALLNALLGSARAGHVRPPHKMQRTFLNLQRSVGLVSARALNNQARSNEVDFTRLKANVSNTGRFVRDMTILPQKAIYNCHCKLGPYRIKAGTNF